MPINYLLEQLRILGSANAMSHIQTGQGLFQIKTSLQTHLPAAGSFINIDLPPVPEYTLHELEALRKIILDTVDNQVVYRQAIVDLGDHFTATVAEAEYLSYLLKQLSVISELLTENKLSLDIQVYDGIAIKGYNKQITISFADEYTQYGKTGIMTTCFEHTPARDRWSPGPDYDQQSSIRVEHDRYMGTGYSKYKASKRISKEAVSHREFMPLLRRIHAMASMALISYREDERTKHLFNEHATLHAFEVFGLDFNLERFIKNYVNELYGDVLYKQVGNYRYMENDRSDGRVLRLAPEEERNQVANYVYYHGNDGITKTIPLRVFAPVQEFQWNSTCWSEREKRQRLVNEGKPLIVSVKRFSSWTASSQKELPYAVTVLLPVQIDYLSAIGKPHLTNAQIVFTISTFQNVPVITIDDVTGFENVDTHVRRWYLEKALIPHLDQLFKGTVKDE